MPELPEVETIKRDLLSNVVGKTITDVSFLWSKTLKNISVREFKKRVIGQKITDVRRRAKNIDLSLSSGDYLLLHMKMTGHILIAGADHMVDKSGSWLNNVELDSSLKDPTNQYIRAIFWLSDGIILAFSDLRKFGYIKLVTKNELAMIYEPYGAEPLTKEFSLKYLAERLKTNNLAIKKILMDQRQIAGIGNIYADEVLWQAGIHPLTKGKNIPAQKVADLFNSIQKILKKAVSLRGTSTSDFRDTAGKKGGYGEALNGTHFCPTCQKESNG
jgi:formamidopyrimidine-DNA glycosylase